MASEYTSNYNLDLYASEDKPNLRDQYNAAMGKIDAQLKANADGVTNVSASVVAATTAANEAKQIAQDAKTAAEAAPPTNHASTEAVYGLGGTLKYGHTKLTDNASSSSTAELSIAATPACVDNKINTQLRPQIYLRDTTYNYASPVSGSGHFKVAWNPITKLVIVEWDNVEMSMNAPSTARQTLFTLPSNMRPITAQFVTVVYDETKNHSVTFEVGYNGDVQLILSGSSSPYKYGGNLHSEIVYYAGVS